MSSVKIKLLQKSHLLRVILKFFSLNFNELHNYKNLNMIQV